MSFDDYREVETREMKKRVKVLADVIPVRLDPAGDLLDHLSTLEHKVYERVYKGPFNKRIERLEDNLETLDDFAYLGLIEDHDENGKRKAIFPVDLESKKPKNDNPTSEDLSTALSLARIHCCSQSSSEFDVGNVSRFWVSVPWFGLRKAGNS